jgi:hypothetical protein
VNGCRERFARDNAAMPGEIHIYSKLELRDARQALEDDIEEHFSGELEVTGGGSGNMGWNIDVALLDEDASALEMSQRLSLFLQKWGVPRDTYMHVLPFATIPPEDAPRIKVYHQTRRPKPPTKR